MKDFFIDLLKKIKEYFIAEKKWLLPLLFGIAFLIVGSIILINIIVSHKKSADKYDALVNSEAAEEDNVSAPALGSEESAYQIVTDSNQTEKHDEADGFEDNKNTDRSLMTASEINGELRDLAGVDLESLMAEYPETVGWIYFENDDLSYPVMQAGDNEKYLTRAYDGSESKGGSIFMDYESSRDFSDPNTLIYGHNMADTTMFGKLHRYINDADYYAENKYFRIYTGDECYRYEVFAYGEVEDSSIVFWTFGPNPETMGDMLSAVSEASFVRAEVTPGEDDHIVTLSTCTALGNKREIVCGVRIPWE